MDPLAFQDPPSLGHFTLLGRLGDSEAATVYLGRSENGEHAAVQVLSEDSSRDRIARGRFESAVTETSSIIGSLVPSVLDADTTAERPWVATAYVRGRTLQRVVEEAGPYGFEQVAVLAHALGATLATAHEHGIVHGDLKPTSLLITREGPWLIDRVR